MLLKTIFYSVKRILIIRIKAPKTRVNNKLNAMSNVTALFLSNSQNIEVKLCKQKFDLLTVASKTHLKYLEGSISKAIQIYGTEIQNISIVTNGVFIPTIKLQQTLKEFNIQLRVEDETHYESYFKKLKKEISRFKFDRYGNDRRGWIKQQLIKNIFVYKNTGPVLIVDADTYLMNRVQWAWDDCQTLLCGAQFHTAYSVHVNRFSKIFPSAISYVHHVQYQRPDVVQKIYGEDIITGLSNWLKLAPRFGEDSAISEFQTYGDNILNFGYPVKIVFHTHMFKSYTDLVENELPKIINDSIPYLVTIIE